MTKFKKEVKEFAENVRSSFHDVGVDVEAIIQTCSIARDEFLELREELATNGVVRDLRKLEKIVADQDVVITGLYSSLQRLGTNGVATAIKKLNTEVFEDKKENSEIWMRLGNIISGDSTKEVTLAGKVDAIIAHLGLDVQVQPEEVIKAKIVTKKVKAAPKKKAGRR